MALNKSIKIMPVTTSNIPTYDLRRRASMKSTDEVAVVRTGDCAIRIRAARAGMSDERRALQRSQNAERRRTAREEMSDERRAVEHSENAARTRTARANRLV